MADKKPEKKPTDPPPTTQSKPPKDGGASFGTFSQYVPKKKDEDKGKPKN